EVYGLMSYHAQAPPTDTARENHHHPFDDHLPLPQDVPHKRKIQTSSSNNNNNNNNDDILAKEVEDEFLSSNRAKIMSHPLYPKLLQAYIACQKVGAPPDIANMFNEISQENDLSRRSRVCSCIGDDPELDEFMETYCEMLDRYRSDLARPFDEATLFLNNMHTQLTDLCNGGYPASIMGQLWFRVDAGCDNCGGGGIKATCDDDESEERSEEDLSMGESDWMNEDRDLKEKLLRKYSKYISSLKHEFSNKKKKGKLPKEARQVLLDWWNIHYRWPYPTVSQTIHRANNSTCEADKIALAESTRLDQKQINNWFINQRKRHWKPSGNMQFAVMDNLCGSSFLVNN
ncbi:hypothetical protein M8C21_027942, partial [Ambrosia artemisiifolia]